MKRSKTPVWVKNSSVGGEGCWRVRRAVGSSAPRQASAREMAQDEGWDYCSWQPPAQAPLGPPLVEAHPAEELSLGEGR